MEHVAALINGGTSPSEIAVAAYTNKAARHIRHRLAQQGVTTVAVGTIHGLARRVVAHGFRESECPRFLDQGEIIRMVHECATLEGLDWTDDEASQTAALMSYHLATDEGLATWREHEVKVLAPLTPESVYRVLQRVQGRLVDTFSLTFDHLLLVAAELPSPGWRVLVVDEAQDLTALQWRAVRNWVGDGVVVMVGDPMQAIFTYAGADPSILADRPGRRLTLEHNYRSTPEIVRASNALRHDGFQARAVRESQAVPVRIVEHPTLEARNAYLAETGGMVLARTNAELVGLTGLTVHKAKGLEWDTVHVIGLTAGNWPRDHDNLDEERRVFYTALTRARTRLELHTITDNHSPLLTELQEAGVVS